MTVADYDLDDFDFTAVTDDAPSGPAKLPFQAPAGYQPLGPRSPTSPGSGDGSLGTKPSSLEQAAHDQLKRMMDHIASLNTDYYCLTTQGIGPGKDYDEIFFRADSVEWTEMRDGQSKTYRYDPATQKITRGAQALAPNFVRRLKRCVDDLMAKLDQKKAMLVEKDGGEG